MQPSPFPEKKEGCTSPAWERTGFIDRSSHQTTFASDCETYCQDYTEKKEKINNYAVYQQNGIGA